ncbi:MAG: hypothetical protein RLZZ293_1084 [Pseudomonadota bacterium]|jgi:hypothetical protein
MNNRFQSTILKDFIRVWTTIIIVFISSIWITQNSINAYWQQTYHQPSLLEKLNLNKYIIWQFGASIDEKINSQYNRFTTNIIVPNINDNIVTIRTVQKKYLHISSLKEKRTTKIIANHNEITLSKNDIVFFAGDSLMQGVAPFVEQNLKKKYGIQSINLSKQSTGLSYPTFFDWPKTIETTLNNQPQIKLLIMFLGPNDPWDFPDPEKSRGAPYLKFASSDWEYIYRSRINKIVQLALSHNVKIIWLNVPYMRSEKLNSQMVYLRSVINKELHDKVLLLPTCDLLSNTGKYSDYILQNGKKIIVRSKDGIHFSGKGQELLAEYILSHINYKSESM